MQRFWGAKHRSASTLKRMPFGVFNVVFCLYCYISDHYLVRIVSIGA